MTRKLISLALALMLCFSLALCVSGESYEEEYVLFDTADLLTSVEASQLVDTLAQVGDEYDVQLVVCTVDTLDGADIDEYADELYRELDIGKGANNAGIMVLVCMDPREVAVFSDGCISGSDRTAIREAITPYLSDGEYAQAFRTFCDECRYYLEGNLNGFPFNFSKTLLISLAIGLVVGLIVAFILKGQLRSVRKQDRANVYVNDGSMNITVQNDFYLYRTVSRVRKVSNNSSGGSGSRGSSSGSF